MTPEVRRAFARYNRWMNAKVYGAAARLSGATDLFAMLYEEAQSAAKS